MKYLYLLFIFALSACASTASVKPNDVVIVPTKETVTIPQEQLSDCDKMQLPELKAYSVSDTLKLIGIWLGSNSECRQNHHALAEVIKKAFNIKDVVPAVESPASAVNNVSNK